MIRVDPRIGSKPGGVHDLVELLRARNLPVESVQLDAGDVAFLGTGTGERPVNVGIEIKAIQDLMACITSQRFVGGQLPALLNTYEYPFLLTVGSFKPGEGGELLLPKGGGWVEVGWGQKRWRYAEVLGYLYSLTINTPLKWLRMYGRHEAAAAIHKLYAWWQEGQDQHRSHLALPPTPDVKRVGFVKPSPCQLALAQLPGLGYEKSKLASDHFKDNLSLAATASAKEWQKVPGVGKVLAERIRAAIEGRGK